MAARRPRVQADELVWFVFLIAFVVVGLRVLGMGL